MDVVPLPRAEIETDMVARLEDLLVRAKAGELSSVAFAWVERDGTTGSDFSKAPYASQLAGSISALQFKYHSSWLSPQ